MHPPQRSRARAAGSLEGRHFRCAGDGAAQSRDGPGNAPSDAVQGVGLCADPPRDDGHHGDGSSGALPAGSSPPAARETAAAARCPRRPGQSRLPATGTHQSRTCASVGASAAARCRIGN